MSAVELHGAPVLPAMVDGEWFGIPAGVVQEVLPAATWVAVPGARPETPGISFWRDRPIAVVDIKALLGGEKALVAGVARARLLIVAVGDDSVAVPVDAAREVRHGWDPHAGPQADPHASGSRGAVVELD